ncbi:GDNF family receptor alpha-2 [Heterocephalus glaber]|uniref:GDNF family receptor alpha-2 n=1 Tax=Heterocephalus glaber TaxID=10181 RepID=G5B9N9_HETGA|nr:GDNF family receptor alpha-2 [Heterocephalus glaber]
MILANAFCLFFFLDETLRSLASPSSLQGPELHGWRPPVDCVRANELCAAESNCSSRYRTLRQCLAGRDRNTMLANKECQAALEVLQESPLYDCLCKRGMKKELQCLQIYWSIHLGLTEGVGSLKCLAGRDRNTMLANKECQAALEVLQESPLYDCLCKRGMKKELQCLQIYWSIHLGLTEGEEFYEASPYEPVTSRLSDIFRLASILSGTGADPAVSAKSNHCLDAAKACNLNDNCKKLRSSYISICNREISSTERCNRRKCHKALRQFFDRVPSEYTYRMLFCSCQDQACAERRRQTILPSCSYEDKEKPNCLELRSLCRTDHLCRSRLADFHTNCRASYRTLTSCPADNYQACLGSYAGMIGFDMTPNYVDSSPSSIVVSPWCSCRGSGNMEEECEKFLRDFTENPCLRNAIQAFGNGTDVNVSPKNPPFQATQAPRVEKTPSLPDDLSDSTSLGTSVITTCTSVQEQGLKANNSKELSMCFTEYWSLLFLDWKTAVRGGWGGRDSLAPPRFRTLSTWRFRVKGSRASTDAELAVPLGAYKRECQNPTSCGVDTESTWLSMEATFTLGCRGLRASGGDEG